MRILIGVLAIPFVLGIINAILKSSGLFLFIVVVIGYAFLLDSKRK